MRASDWTDRQAPPQVQRKLRNASSPGQSSQKGIINYSLAGESFNSSLNYQQDINCICLFSPRLFELAAVPYLAVLPSTFPSRYSLP